jgi:hypothetical protein
MTGPRRTGRRRLSFLRGGQTPAQEAAPSLDAASGPGFDRDAAEHGGDAAEHEGGSAAVSAATSDIDAAADGAGPDQAAAPEAGAVDEADGTSEVDATTGGRPEAAAEREAIAEAGTDAEGEVTAEAMAEAASEPVADSEPKAADRGTPHGSDTTAVADAPRPAGSSSRSRDAAGRRVDRSRPPETTARPERAGPRRAGPHPQPARSARERTGARQIPALTEPAAATVPVASRDVAAERRLAGIHLRLGALALARAELESLATTDDLDPASFADLAEAQWRTGALERAGAAAEAHLAAGGSRAIARIIAAEAAMASGRPDAARTQLALLSSLPEGDLATLFAGMPQLAFWSPAGGPGADASGGPSDADASPTPASRPARAAPDDHADRQAPGLWGESGPEPATPEPTPAATVRGPGRRRGVVAAPPVRFPDPAEAVARARDELRIGDPERVAAGLARLALVLRLDPAMAATVIETLGRRPEPAAEVIRGDAYRILGRTLEAEAAYAAAAATLEGRRARMGS